MLWSKVWWERRCPDGAGGCPSERAGIRQQWSVQSVRWEVSAEKNFRAGTGVVLNSWWRGEGRSGSPAVSAKYVAFIENTMPKLRYERRHHVCPQFPRFFYASGFCTETIFFLCPWGSVSAPDSSCKVTCIWEQERWCSGCLITENCSLVALLFTLQS